VSFSGYSTKKTDSQVITEILVKVALNTINLSPYFIVDDLSLNMTFCQIFSMSSMTGATNGAVLNCLPFQSTQVHQSLIFCVGFCLFHLLIVLHVLQLINETPGLG
jgi:hypothetical protein